MNIFIFIDIHTIRYVTMAYIKLTYMIAYLYTNV